MLRRCTRPIAALTAIGTLLLVGQAGLGRRAFLTKAGKQPTPSSVVVRRGDTLWNLSRRYHLDLNQLATANGMRLTDVLLIGRRLVLPVKGQPVAPPATVDPKAAKVAANPAINPPKPLTPDDFTPGQLAQMRGFCGAYQPPTVPQDLPGVLLAHPERMKLRPTFVKYAKEANIPADLVEALAWQESGWQNDVVSSADAHGIGQLLPQTAAFVNKLLHAHLDVKKPADNIRLTAHFLAVLLQASGGHVCEAVASYYQGFATLLRIGALPESQVYVNDVLQLRPRFH